VGEHILLGGDNIDLALAGVVAQRLAEKGTRIDSRSISSCGPTAASPRETAGAGLKGEGTAGHDPGQGHRLVGGTIKAALERDDVERVLGEGFLPQTDSSEMPAAQRRVGVQELGLPYAADAAITRHMARFLRQQAAGVEHGSVRRGPSSIAAPTHVLFNGGVLNAGLVRERISRRHSIRGWRRKGCRP